MAKSSPAKLRVFIDADVLFAGSASSSEQGASLTLLRLAEITLIEAVASEQVVIEAERNLALKLPEALPVFRLLVARCLKVVPSPNPAELAPFAGLAVKLDQSILAAAVLNACPWLVTFNTRHYQPGHPDVTVLPPGDLVQKIRYLLSDLSAIRPE
jgi:hypothetical protein